MVKEKSAIKKKAEQFEGEKNDLFTEKKN